MVKESGEWMVWYHLPLWCSVVKDEESGEFVATIPDVDDLEGRAHSAQDAAKDLAVEAFLRLRM